MKSNHSKADEIDVIAPNLKRRLSGVTATIARLVPLQARQLAIVSTGPGLPENLPHISLLRALMLKRNKWRVWHARRNTEMLLGVFARYILRRRFRLLFTSASQRQHTRYTKWLIGKMDRVIATSQKTAQYLKRPAKVILHGIDTDQFCPASSQKALREKLNLPEGLLIGCYGRIRAQKGTDVFVDTMIALCERSKEPVGLVMGRATKQHSAYLDRQREKVEAAGLSARILFCPEVPVDQMAAWYQVLDLFVAPQRWEGFGLTPLEAMACGVPTIATRVGAFDELITESVTGRLVSPDCVQEMLAAVEALCDNVPMRRACAAAARLHMLRNFTLSREADEITQVYRNMLHEKNPS